jgi:hypothetical protein
MQGMDQITLGLDPLPKKTRKEVFLDEMNRVVPWPALVALIRRPCKILPPPLFSYGRESADRANAGWSDRPDSFPLALEFWTTEPSAMTTNHFFRARLDGMVDQRHSLVVLGTRLPWSHRSSTPNPPKFLASPLPDRVVNQ